MALSLGLMISLGVTTLLCLLLFFYIRQRTASIDMKLNSLFKIVQDEVSKNQSLSRPLNYAQQQDMTVTEVQRNNMVASQNVHSNVTEEESDNDDSSVVSGDSDEDLISVSTGSSDHDDSDVESDDGNDNGSDDGSEYEEDQNDATDIKVIHSNTDGELKTEINDLKTLTDLNMFSAVMNNRSTNEDSINNDTNLEDEDLDELSEIESLGLIQEDEDNGLDDKKENTNVNKVNNDSDNTDVDNTDVDNIEQSIINFKKLSVSQLRNMVAEKNLHDNPKKLKKSELVELLEA